MTCQLCKEFREQHPLVADENGEMVHVLDVEDGVPWLTSSPIKCAFEDSDVFSTDNWCCETMGRLREVGDNSCCGPIWHNDSNLSVIQIPISEEEDIQRGMLVLSWYKSRGRTGQAVVFCDDNEPVTLNLRTAMFIIEKR